MEYYQKHHRQGVIQAIRGYYQGARKRTRTVKGRQSTGRGGLPPTPQGDGSFLGDFHLFRQRPRLIGR
jgi:hypothetical protein